MTAVQQAVDEEEDPAQEKVKEGCNDNPGAFGRPPLCAAAGIYDDHFPKCISIIHRIVRKILHRAELQFTCCSAGDADPATLQIKRACNELEPTDTFPLKLYAEIVSNVILYRDTHIEIKLRNGQIL